MSRMTKGKAGKIITSAVLGVLAFLAVYPVAFLFVGSLTGQTELSNSLGPALAESAGYIQFQSCRGIPRCALMCRFCWIRRNSSLCSGIP